MSKHGSDFNEQHSEVEGLVSAFRKEFQADRGYGTDPQFVGGAFDINDYTDWLRTALLTHGAKEREAVVADIQQWIANYQPTYTDRREDDWIPDLLAHLATLPQV